MTGRGEWSSGVRTDFETRAIGEGPMYWKAPGTSLRSKRLRKRRCCALLLIVSALWAGALAGSSPVAAASPIRHIATNGNMVDLRVTVDKAETIAADRDFSDVLVGNAQIADVVTLTSKTLYILGKKVGMTSITLLGSDKRVMGVVNVEVTYDIDGLKQRLHTLVPGSNISVSAVGGKILLAGTVRDTVSLSKAMSLAEQVAPQAVTNAMVVRGSQQVLLEVRFVEANRESARDLGVGWDIFGGRVTAAVGVTDVAPGGVPVFGLVSNNVPFGAVIARLLDNGTKADVIVQALEKRGLARRLAEPNLVALSGDTASFLAGGEFPFPVAADNDKITVEFKRFGVGLAFTPTVLGDGLINIKIEPEVSELDPTTTLRIEGVEIPSLIVRRAQTTVELRDGQSFAIAGLINSTNFKSQRQLPWVADVPVIGALARSAAFQKKETDLVIIVTPHLVNPAKPGQRLATPLDGRVPSNDREFFLRGEQEKAVGRPQPLHGHILDISGASGADQWRAK
jgi:pilus assembly protein CpaC